MQPNDRKDLGYLGNEFQKRLVKIFFVDKNFFKDLVSVIDQNMFTDGFLRAVVSNMKEQYEKYETVPSFETMATVLQSKIRNEIDKEQFLALLEELRTLEIDSVDYIKDLSSKFFKQQNIVKVANTILKIAEQGDDNQYEQCVDLLQSALNAGNHNELGNAVFDEINETLSDDYRATIPTGIGKLDEALEGGLGKGELGLIIGPSGFGKSQPLDARIITPTGWKAMGDIKVGDEVIGRDGKPHAVIGVYPQGMRPIYKVSFSNGTSCECDIEHLWAVNTKWQRNSKKYVKGLSKSRDDKYYAPDLTYRIYTLQQIIDQGLRRGVSFNFKVPKCEKIEMQAQPLRVDPYAVGYFLGDGSYNRMSVTMGVKDYTNASALLREALHGDIHDSFYAKRNIWGLNIVGESRRALQELFAGMGNAETKYIPQEYLFNSISNRLSVLQGLMDSDGCANKNGSCEFSSKSKQLALDVQFLVRSLGGYASITEASSSYFNKEKGVRVDCGKRYRVTISMCDEELHLFRLERKQERVKYRGKYANNIYISNVEYAGEKEAQCIMVDSEEHLYLTEDFIVTHNTTVTTAMASHAATYKCDDNLFQGYKVLQIVFEDRIKQIQRKHIGKITGVEAKDLSKPEFIDHVKEILESYPDREMLNKNLRIVRFPSGEITASAIKRYIKKLINTGFKPDLLIVDYFECLEHEKLLNTSTDYEREGKTMRKFEAMAGEMDMAIWIPSQGSRDSINMEIVTMDKVSGSIKKAQIAHVIVSIARSIEDIDNNKATISLLKNRAGKSGKVWNNVDFNNGTCKISTDNTDDYESVAMYGKSKQDENAKLQAEIFKRIQKQANK